MATDPTDPLDEAIRRTRAGDVEAFDGVVRACGWPLRCWLAGRCPPEIDPDEVAHLALVTAFRSLAEYRDGTSFRSWLWTIARNQLLAQLTTLRRQQANREAYLPEAVRRELERRVDDGDDADEPTMRALRECLGRLAPTARTVIDRHYRDGFPLAAIAAELRKTTGAVKKQVFTIRRALRDCIESRPGALP